MKQWKKLLVIMVCVCVLVAAVYFLTRPTAIEKDVDMTTDGYILLADGQKLPCTLKFQGTVYVGSRKVDSDQFYPGADGGIWVNDVKVLDYYVFLENDRVLGLNGPTGIFYLKSDLSIFAGKVDSALLKLDIPQQDVYVVLGDYTMEEYAPILAELERVSQQQTNRE